ncbi:MAG: sulfur carrier protein ThiS [Pseudonocardiales bacterium]|nr:sulfur carrier protein ThiS [Pseudonocardiales bacterium]
MRILVNGESRTVADGASVVDVITALGAPKSGVAVAVDGEVVPRADWAVFRLSDAATVEVLTAVQGG